MGRLQRKARKPQGKGIRTAYTFDQKVAMKRMKAKGYSFEKVKDELTLPKLAKSTFYHIISITLGQFSNDRIVNFDCAL